MAQRLAYLPRACPISRNTNPVDFAALIAAMISGIFAFTTPQLFVLKTSRATLRAVRFC